MQQSQIKAKSIKRIYRDLSEIEAFPIEGLGICIPDQNNQFELRANILILDGNYKDILLHLIMNIPENYPSKAPQMTIAPGQDFTHDFHHHLFDDGSGGQTICIDLLDHGFFAPGEKTGWTPAYTLSTVLMQMQIFFAKDYDLPHPPNSEKIEELKGKLKKFQIKIRIADGGYIWHTYDKPFPSINKANASMKLEETKT